jgi:hypothetical protein
MKSSDLVDFAAMMNGLGEYYGKQISPSLTDIYWNGLQQYDFAEVSSAVNAHVRNTETGQFMPKISDVERYLHGSTGTRAMQAWLRVANAIQAVGTYETVAFDDPLIHACIEDMGGWPSMGQISNDELPFKIREFEKRYMAYLQSPPLRVIQPFLLGLYETHDRTLGYRGLHQPIMIADVEKKEQALRLGNTNAQYEPVKIEPPPDPEKLARLQAIIRDNTADDGKRELPK